MTLPKLTLLKCSWLSMLLLMTGVPFNYSMAQVQQKISGTITDGKGSPAVGITVTVKGTKKVTVTAQDGSFSATAKEGDVLVLSSISFVKKEVPVTKESFYKIEMEQATTALTVVVVV